MSAQPQKADHAMPRSISILGVTGSIGQSALKIIREQSQSFQLAAITAQENVASLIAIAKELRPEMVAIGNAAHYNTLKDALASLPIRVSAGDTGLMEAASLVADVTVSAIVGAAGLRPTLAVIRRGGVVALANKECLVCAGDLIRAELRKHNATLLPVDSEHSAIFQVFDFERPERIEKITLTASGGPFRTLSAKELANVTPEQAVRHPNWSMGAKISVDSATLMNKGLELIEAYHLFPMREDQIDVVIHPESIIHGLVHYVDGSVLAQMSPPDMCTPLAVALAWPERIPCSVPKLDLTAIGKLSFEAPDHSRFPALSLARAALRQGGSAPAVLNAANEVAVMKFLNKSIPFAAIVPIVEQTLNQIDTAPTSSLDALLAVDAEARACATQITENI